MPHTEKSEGVKSIDFRAIQPIHGDQSTLQVLHREKREHYAHRRVEVHPAAESYF
jgi:hypothetical protein